MKYVPEGTLAYFLLKIHTQDVLVKYTSYLYPPTSSYNGFGHNTILIKTYQTQSLLINNEVRVHLIVQANKDTSYYEAYTHIARFSSIYICYNIDGKFNSSTHLKSK